MIPSPDLQFFGLCGGSRSDSLNTRLLARAAAALPACARLETAAPAALDLPLYAAEREAGVPPGVSALAGSLARADGVIVASPEHNASIPAALKNLLDRLSRLPGGERPFSGKPALLLSAAPARLGGARGLAHLRDVLTALGTEVVLEQVALARAHTAIEAAEADAAHPLNADLDAALVALLGRVNARRRAAA